MTPPVQHDGHCERVIGNCVALAKIEPEVAASMIRLDKLESKMDINTTELGKISVKIGIMSFIGSIVAAGIFQLVLKIISG